MRDQSWHVEEEEFLTKLERQCNELYDHYSKEHRYYHQLSAKFNIPILVLSSVNALTAICLNDFLGQKYVSILNAVLSAGTGIIGSIQLFMKLNEKMTNALRGSLSFRRIALKISKELTLARDDRTTEGQSFLSECFSEYNKTIEQSNPLEKRLPNHLQLGKAISPPVSSPRQKLTSVAQSLLSLGKNDSSVDSSPKMNQQIDSFDV
jgi:hypothetical protein